MTSSTTATPPPAGKRKMFNFLFIGVCLLILLFLWFAPPETTPRVPQDEEHLSFTMERKAAESYCDNCHHPDGSQPLSEEHPTTFRCLFCHKRDPLPANP